MTPERFARIEQIFDEARGLSAEQRTALLDELCANDTDLRKEVEALLEHEAPTPPPLVERLSQADVGGASAAAGDAAMIGRRVGPYTITRVLGRGGMGVVYLGQDTALHRPVAIKTLPPDLVNHPTRANRLLREARLLASLSHPNVATVYSVEESAGTRALVMELVGGETLARRLAAGPLAIERALDVCRQVAAGVEAAHNAGVIHRDLKPGNVMLAPDDVVKVLDFGLARAADPPSGISDASGGHPADDAADPHPHVTRPLVHTVAGAVVGTPGYMSPEQLRGRPVDRRTDVFAFGCLLYECLTGRVAFTGPSAADVAAAVLDRDPDWAALPPRTPAVVVRLLKRCLAKDRNQRTRDVGDARLELEEALAAREWLAPLAGARAGPRWPWVVAACAAVAIALAAVVALALRDPADRPPLRRFTIPMPGDVPQTDLPHVRVALSPDGARMALSASRDGAPSLYVRERDQYAFRPIPETADAWLPAFSPDGRWLAYFDAGVMRRMPVGGGASTRVTDVTGYFSGYGWGDDGWVVHAPYWGRGIARVHHEGGGRGEFLTSVDFANNEFAHVNASVVRGTPWVLYAVWDGKDGLRIDAIDAKTKRRHTVVESGTCPKVARTPYGPHLLWERAGTVYAAPFDLDTALRTGPAVTVAEGVMNDRVLFYSVYDVADDGTLAYVPGPMFLQDVRLAWLKPGDAAATPFNDDQLPFVEPNFSADGNLLTVILKNDVFTPYVYHLKAKTFDRIVVPGDCESAAISPDGKRLAYTANPDGPYNVYVKDLASGTIDQIDSGLVGYPCAIGWSPDGRSVAYAGRLDEWAQRDVFVVDVATRTRRGFAASPGVEERSPRFSPDGKWIAYMGNDSGQREVLIRSYPSGAQTRQVSFGGGDWPQWSPDGKQVYYRARGKLYATTIDPATGGVVYRGRLVYDRPFGQSSFEMPDYTVHPDGRLLLVEPTPAGPGVAQVNVIVNWHELLRPRS